MLKEQMLFDKIDRVKTAILRLKSFEPPEGYYLAFSGGKDSVVIKALADMAKVKYDAHYNVTTIDPPELVYFIRDYHKDVIWDHPKEPMLRLMPKRGFPDRRTRWCCSEYKEKGGSGWLVMTGIRQAESIKRSKRKMVESCFRDTSKRYLNPIIDWSDNDVWEFIHGNNIPYCKLYDEGYKRLGCILCPLAVKWARDRDAEKYPKYVELFIRAFNEIHKRKKEKGLISVDRWKNGEEMFWWWMDDNRTKNQPDQLVMFE